MRSLVVGCALSAACGRVHFDPLPAGFDVYAAVQAGSISALRFEAGGIVETARLPLATPVDELVLDPSGAYLLEAGGDLGSYSFDASGAPSRVSGDGGGQYSTTHRMRIAFHPTLPWFYLTGDSTGANNILTYQLEGGAIVASGDVGTEATPIGIAIDATGALAYTTSGLAAASACVHPVNTDGTLGVMQCPTATCAQPLELFALPDRIVIACTSGVIAVHVLDAMGLPTAMAIYSEPSGFRGAQLSASGEVYAATGGDELVRVDPVALAEVGRTPLRAGTTGIAVSRDERYVIGGDPLGIAAYDRDTGFALVAATPSDIGGSAISVVAHPR